MQYPQARRDSVVDDYHGVPVPDPYRWLEDPSSADTVAWSEAQSALTRSYLDSFPGRERVIRRVTALTDYPKHGLPSRKGARYFMTYNPGLDNQPVLYRVERLDGPRTVVIDPNAFSPDGTVAIESLFYSNDGAVFYFKTDLDAPRGRVVAIDVTRPDRASWRELVAEQDAVLSVATMVNDQLVLVYERDAHHQLQVHELDGSFVHTIELPTFGSITGITGEREDRELFCGFTSFLRPPSVHRYDFATRKLSLLYPTASRDGASVDLDAERYETRQVFYRSKDGTRVPMFLTHRKGLVLDGGNPTILYGYGGFKISLLPGYSELIAHWVEHGGVYAVANIRGGNEYGERWHEAAMLGRKQNVFDDFIAAAEWLVAGGYTSPSRLASYGGSNGGLLVAACMVQRPELYGAVLCAVPVADMLRFHRFTVGRYWVVEYGNAESSPEQFRFLLAYSPLHNVSKGVAYPPTLILTADTDDRVVPAHAKKLAAALQAATGGDAPIMLRLEPRAGHGHGKPVSKRRDEICDCLTFLYKVFEVEVSPVSQSE